MTTHETAKLDEIHAEIKDIKRILLGNGQPEKGVVFRLAQLEGKAKRATWIITTALAAIATAAAEFAFSIVRHR